MKRKISTRAAVFIASIAAFAAVPAAASAQCGTLQGSFVVTCEQGVQVYRHNAQSPFPRGLSESQTQVELANIRARSERARLLASQRSEARTNALRERELSTDAYRARIEDEFLRGRNSRIGTGFNGRSGFIGTAGFVGFNRGVSSRVRSKR